MAASLPTRHSIFISTPIPTSHIFRDVINYLECLNENHTEGISTTKPLGKGTGLKLSLCYSIIKRLGGEITVESEPGEGTKSSILFSLTPPTNLAKSIGFQTNGLFSKFKLSGETSFVNFLPAAETSPIFSFSGYVDQERP
ncbi:MAG: hypothetical protein J7K30_04795 [Deltaproteobacteria bacterium]|nr:hypothetical protein [Deltaproteobacteria bacterium]